MKTCHEKGMEKKEEKNGMSNKEVGENGEDDDLFTQILVIEENGCKSLLLQ